jgi:hypothetical protein
MAGPITRVFDALHGYIYGRWTVKYIFLLRDKIIPRLKPQGRRRVADGFHSKVIPSEEANLQLLQVLLLWPRSDGQVRRADGRCVGPRGAGGRGALLGLWGL